VQLREDDEEGADGLLQMIQVMLLDVGGIELEQDVRKGEDEPGEMLNRVAYVIGGTAAKGGGRRLHSQPRQENVRTGEVGEREVTWRCSAR
jgi:hypothetical protein